MSESSKTTKTDPTAEDLLTHAEEITEFLATITDHIGFQGNLDLAGMDWYGLSRIIGDVKRRVSKANDLLGEQDHMIDTARHIMRATIEGWRLPQNEEDMDRLLREITKTAGKSQFFRGEERYELVRKYMARFTDARATGGS